MERQHDSTGRFAVFFVFLAIGWAIGLGQPGHPQYQTGCNTKERATQSQLALFQSALDLYRQDYGRYPTAEQGLEALLQEAPAHSPVADRPYLLEWTMIPLDPWGNPYIYLAADDQGEYLIISRGPDGIEDTDDDLYSDLL